MGFGISNVLNSICMACVFKTSTSSSVWRASRRFIGPAANSLDPFVTAIFEGVLHINFGQGKFKGRCSAVQVQA